MFYNKNVCTYLQKIPQILPNSTLVELICKPFYTKTMHERQAPIVRRSDTKWPNAGRQTEENQTTVPPDPRFSPSVVFVARVDPKSCSNQAFELGQPKFWLCQPVKSCDNPIILFQQSKIGLGQPEKMDRANPFAATSYHSQNVCYCSKIFGCGNPDSQEKYFFCRSYSAGLEQQKSSCWNRKFRLWQPKKFNPVHLVERFSQCIEL